MNTRYVYNDKTFILQGTLNNPEKAVMNFKLTQIKNDTIGLDGTLGSTNLSLVLSKIE